MELILGARASGKSRKLLDEYILLAAARRPALLVAFGEEEAARLRELLERQAPGWIVADEKYLASVQSRIVGISSARVALHGMPVDTIVLIDELPDVLNALFGRRVRAVSLTPGYVHHL